MLTILLYFHNPLACYKAHRSTYYKEHYQKYHEKYLLRAKLRHEGLRNAHRAFMLTYMSDKACVICGEVDIRVLELDHLDPSKKKFSVSQAAARGFNIEDVVLEIKKCRVLCANCHKKHTAQQMGWYKAI